MSWLEEKELAYSPMHQCLGPCQRKTLFQGPCLLEIQALGRNFRYSFPPSNTMVLYGFMGSTVYSWVVDIREGIMRFNIHQEHRPRPAARPKALQRTPPAHRALPWCGATSRGELPGKRRAAAVLPRGQAEDDTWREWLDWQVVAGVGYELRIANWSGVV